MEKSFEKVSAEFRKKIEEILKTTIIENFQKEMVEEDFYKYEVQLQSIKFVTYMSNEELEKSIELSFSERYPYKSYKYRYDITVFNNFLTTKKFTEKCSDTLKDICKYTRNHGLVIVIGATEKSDKYKEIYNIIDGIINRKFKGRYYYGYWNKVFDREFNYKYEDQYGCVLGEYFKNIVNYLKENNLWGSVSETEKKNLK